MSAAERGDAGAVSGRLTSLLESDLCGRRNIQSADSVQSLKHAPQPQIALADLRPHLVCRSLHGGRRVPS